MLLSGQAVDVGMGSRISADDQSGGVGFCMDLLAKKLVVSLMAVYPMDVIRPLFRGLKTLSFHIHSYNAKVPI